MANVPPKTREQPDLQDQEDSGITHQVFSIASSTMQFAANTFFGSLEKASGSDSDLENVITRLESLPIQSSQSKTRTTNDNSDDTDKHSTEAVSIPTMIKRSTSTSTPINSTSAGITFGMGSSWKSSRRIRSTNSESGYGSSFYGSSVRSNLSLLEHKEETPEKQKYLDQLPLISLQDVQSHCYEDDAWMVIYDRVYNVTDFLIQHPGGMDVMLEYLGYDATMAFQGVGHSQDAIEMMEQYLIGILPKSERAYNSGSGWTEIW